jgi:hypothetical protein
MKRIELYALILNNSAAIEWCRERGLLSNHQTCPTCGEDMKIENHKCNDSEIWRCRKMVLGTKHDCKLSIRSGSVFEGSNLSIREILFILYEWAVQSPAHMTGYELSISQPTVCSWYLMFRRIVSTFMETRLSGQIGGPGDVVEIDECQVGRRKHHRGRRSNEVWLFGAIVRNAVRPRIIIQKIRRRNRQTLEPLIERHIHISSRVISDGWSAYSGLQALGYNHSVVNHSKNFVSPEDITTHTQNIENLWRCLRRFLNQRSSYSRRHLSGYITEFIFRKRFIDPFETMISAIESQYPFVL